MYCALYNELVYKTDFICTKYILYTLPVLRHVSAHHTHHHQGAMYTFLWLKYLLSNLSQNLEGHNYHHTRFTFLTLHRHFFPLWSSERQPLKAPFLGWWGSAACLVPVTVGEGEKLLLGANICFFFFKGRRGLLTKLETVLKNN
jgi:hypothetical protein